MRLLQGDFAISVFLGSEYKYSASWVPLLWDVPKLSLDKSVRVQALLYLRDFL